MYALRREAAGEKKCKGAMPTVKGGLEIFCKKRNRKKKNKAKQNICMW